MYWDRGYDTEEALRAYFKQTCVTLGYVGQFDVYFDVIVARYSNPKRSYHDLWHIAQMLEWFDSHFPEKLLESEAAHLVRLGDHLP